MILILSEFDKNSKPLNSDCGMKSKDMNKDDEDIVVEDNE